MSRSPRILHATSEPYRFFGRVAELQLLDDALRGGKASVLALVGPGGQGKTAITQHWLDTVSRGSIQPQGIFLWSFYRGKDVDLCLREWYAYAEGLHRLPDVSASYCVDHLLVRLRQERWAVVLDGTEVVQHESGAWLGRFVHPELGRLLEELASEPLPGVVAVTTRFPLPTLSRRAHAVLLSLATLDSASACGLLESLGVEGSEEELDAIACVAGHHAKAVELLGTYLVRFEQGKGTAIQGFPQGPALEDASDEEQRVFRVLHAYQQRLEMEARDMLALATAFREPPTEARLIEYLGSDPVHALLHTTWGRDYTPLRERGADWIQTQVNELVRLRLLERVRSGSAGEVIDAHPLVRRAFENALGGEGQRAGARTRAGFLHGRPDRRRPDTLEEAREEVELFHAFCDGQLWTEADNAYRALDNPKHRFLAPALERDLLLRFFPSGDWRQPALWPGFGRHRSLAICFELLGQFEEALAVYREHDAALRGDALIALGQLAPLLDRPSARAPWQTLWAAYRCHALCLADRIDEALALVRVLVPVDVYEWVHLFECLLRTRNLELLDLHSLLYHAPRTAEHQWAALARQRMQLDHRRFTEPTADLESAYRNLLEAYDRGGLPFERALTRLSYARWLLTREDRSQARAVASGCLELAQQYRMAILEVDAWELLTALDPEEAALAEGRQRARLLRTQTGYRGPERP